MTDIVMTDQQTYTIEEYLRGIVNIAVTDEALKSICMRLKIAEGADYNSLSEREIDLSTAWLYVWLASSPSTSNKVSDKDGDWSHSEGGVTMSKDVLKSYLKMANALFEKWGEPTINKDGWGMIVGGFHNIRNYDGRSRRSRRY